MTRVATIPMQRTLFDSIARSQARLAESQLQMATGKKANDYAALGIEAVRNLSARTLLARQEAHGAVANRLQTTLAIADTNLASAEGAAESLRAKLLEAIGTGRTSGLQGVVDEAFGRFRYAMNADEAGVALFAGSRTGSPPFVPGSLAATVGVPASAAFVNDDVKATARVADGNDMVFGLTASEIGSELYEAFRTIAEAGPLGDTPTAAQAAALVTAVGQLNGGLKQVRAQWSENGRRQAQVDELAGRASERTLILSRLIANNEDADMAEVASVLTQRRTALEASYTVFGRLSQLSLVNYLP